MSVEETASCLAIPGDTVKTRFHRVKLLRQALTMQFGAMLDDIYPFLGGRCARSRDCCSEMALTGGKRRR